MTNRLRKLLRALPFCVGLFLCLLPTTRLSAQPDFFNFNYNGPDTLSVDINCSTMLQGNIPNPVVTSTMGFTIITSMFDAVSAGFQYNDLFTSGTVAHVYWFVEDNMGHSHTYEYFIQIVDNMPPTFDLTGVFNTLEFSSVVQIPPQTALPILDNCTGVVSDTFFQTALPDTCQTGIVKRTWIATDENSNTAVFTQTIIIYADTLSPLITGYPQNGSAPCEQLATAYPVWLANQVAIFNATDASGIASLTNNAPPTFPPGCKEPLTVRFKAVDNCQFQLNVDVVFTTSDTQGPIVVKPPKDTVAYCSQNDNELTKLQEWISTRAYSQAFDTCSAPLTYSMKIGTVVRDSAQVVAAFLASFANGCSTQTIGTKEYNKVHGFVSVNFFAKDDCGNETFLGNADFGAIDTLPPVVSGVNITEQCGGGNDQSALQTWINAHGNATVVEDCSDYSWTNFTFTTSSGQSGSGNFNAGPYPSVQANNCTWSTNVTFRVTDDCGNSSTITLRWDIVDNQVPTFIGLQPNITVYCPNPLPTIPAAVVTDNCDANVAISFTRVYQDSLCDGSYTVVTTWTATDDCNNTASATQNIFVSDTTRPIFTLIPPDQTFRCDTFVLPPVPVMGVNIMATDVCSPVISITTSTNSLQNPNPDSCGHYSYDIIRTFTAMDECGNTRTATQTITVIDNLGPVGGGVLDTTALCSALVPFPAPTPIATDACSGLTDPPTNNGQTITPGLCTDRYTIAVHWVAEDVCGNKTSFDQLVYVIDTVPPTLMNIPPNITVECDAIPAPPETALFDAADNCDLAVTVTLVQTEIRSSDTTSCEYWTDYIVQREWTATDNCGNSRTYTQQIQIEDTTPPAIVPPTAMMFPNDMGDCGAELMIPAPLAVTDVCSDQNVTVLVKDTMLMVVSPNTTNVVDTIVFQLNLPNASPTQPIIGNATLTIFIDEADAESMLAQEFFHVLGEGDTIGKTNYVPSQCASGSTAFTLPANVINSWITDGILTITLAPNNQSINLVCTNFLNRVRANLSYVYSNSAVPIELEYSLDGGASQSYPPPGPTFLSAGTHTVIYTATDCAGNSSTSSVQITVNDTEPPSMVAPSNITVFTNQNNCEGTVMLPFPVITENCSMSANLSLASAVMPLHFVNNPDIGLVASDIFPMLTGIVPNAVGTGVLKIRHKGDNAQLGEFFNVYDQVGNPIDTTDQGSMLGECATFFETPIPVSAQDINNWALIAGPLGTESFFLEANTNAPTYMEFIGNCAPLLPNGTDGISQVQVVLEYSYAVVDYSIKNALNQVVSTGTLTGNTTKDTLPPGIYTVMYLTTDNAGLTSMTSFAVTVRDTVKPKAICKPTFIVQIDPSGAEQYTLAPTSVNNGSFDNCTPAPNLTYSVTPNMFTCNQAGSPVTVTMTVTDNAGNSATCQTIVGIVTKTPTPSYIPVCEGYELQLSANPPSIGPYSAVLWNGPNGYVNNNNQLNPVVTNNAMAIHNGTYCVTITGATGCTSSACVVVELAILDEPATLSSNGTSFCPGQNIVLSTNSYNGINVSYQWLVDSPSGLVELGVTNPATTFTISNLAPGTYTYYLKVFANGCNTALSNPITITMHPTPPANAEPEMTLVCEGQSISLQSPTPPTGGLTYTWTGPNSYSSTAQNPLVASSAVEAQHEGKYILVTQRNGCFSNPDTVMVNINPKPAKPSLSGLVNVCEGQTISLVCNTMSADQWIWTSPQFGTFFTGPLNSGNVLQIPNANQLDEGNWTVIVSANNCFSDESNPIPVNVQAYPQVMAGSNAPICQDSLLKLTASYTSADSITFWSWNGPAGFTSLVQNPIQPNGASGVYQVIANTSFGCADTATVNVTNVVAPLISFIGNNAPACCNGTAATLTATVNSGNHPLTYQWTGPGNPAFSSTLASPVIGDACVDDNGQYTLIVKDSFGCPSLPATTAISIQSPPPAPTLSVNPPQPVCAGTNVLLTVSPPTAGASYLWNRPGSLPDTTTLSAFLNIPNAQTWHTGGYTVTVISANGTCQSSPSNTVTLTVYAIPATPTVGSNSPVCEGGVLELYGPTIQNAMYFWTGPFGFVSNLEDPTRMQVMTGMAGQYKLRVEVNNCSSAMDSTLVQVVPTPNTPQILKSSGRICIDSPVSDFLNVVNPQNGMVYTWENAASGIVLQSSTATSLFLGLPNVLALGPGAQTFRVIASTPGPAICNSVASNVVSVDFDTIPAGINAFAGLDHYACVDSAIQLFGTPNPLTGALEGGWTQIGGNDTVTIFGMTTPNASFFGMADSTYIFRWSLSNGACSNFSSDDITIMAQNPEIANAGPDIYSCEIVGIQLHATQGTTTQGKWTQLGSQSGLGVVIDDPLNPNTTISGLPGRGQNFAFTWEIENEGCGKSVDVVEVFVYNVNPNAGANQFICSNEDCAQLQASTINPSFETGVWRSNNLGLDFTINSPNSAEVCGLLPGTNVIYWEINNGACGDRSRDTLEVFYAVFPTTNDDAVSVSFGTAATVNVLANDNLPSTFTVAITIPPVNGTIVDEPVTGTYIYRPGSGFTGTDVMTYRVCNTQCPDACSFATVTFNVGGLPDCVIPTIITPNADGFNDVFTIPALCTVGGGAANLEVTIFNQWGDLVFHEKPYLNNWGGTYNNEDLPAGTYFFVVKLNEVDKPLTGFLLIQR